MVTDPIADLLTRIKNAISRKRTFVYAPYSNLVADIVKILKEKTIIDGFTVVEPEEVAQGRYAEKRIKIDLAYDTEEGRKVSRITDMKRMSRPGVRSYSGYRDLQKVRSGFGVAIISTSKGLMTDYEAKKSKMGGEILFEIW